MKLKRILLIFLVAALSMGNQSCEPSSDTTQRIQQERILAEGTAQVGMPSVPNFRERKLLKDIIEMRDQDGLVTYTYIVAEATGQLILLGESIGYGIPASTQFTNPMKREGVEITLPQADPNGLFSPSSSDGTWVMLKDPRGDKVRPVLVEPRCIVSPFKL
jgi:hypothetical protein